MWWRVLLFVIALTCTLQSEVTADADDVLCVIFLSGLKKDDLDVNLLEKLLRHNVNINNINDRKTIEKCLQHTSSQRSTENGHTEITMATKSTQPEETSSQLKYNTDEITRIKDISSKDNENTANIKEKQKEISNYADLTPSYENFIKLWKIVNKTRHQDFEKNIKTATTTTTSTTEKSMTVNLPLYFEKEKQSDYQANDVDLVRKILENYISARKTVTSTKPTITQHQPQNPVDIVSQQIIQLLNNKNVGRESEKNQSDLIGTQKTKSKANGVQETPKKNTDITIFNTTGTENSRSDKLRNSNFDPFTDFNNLWTKLDKTDQQDSKNKAAKIIEHTPITFHKQTKDDSQAKDIDFMHKMFESYFSQQRVTTRIPATTEEQTDIVSQQMQKILKYYKPYETAYSYREPEEIDKSRHFDIYELHHEKSPMRKSSNVALRESSSEKVFVYNLQSNIPNLSSYIYEDINQLENNKRVVTARSNVSKKTPTNLNRNGDIDPQSIYIEMFKAYIEDKFVQTSTQQPPIKPKHTDLMVQEIEQYLEHNDTNNNKNTYEDDILSDSNAYLPHDRNLHRHKSMSTENNNQQNYQDQSDIPTPTERKFKDEQLSNLLFIQANGGIRLPHTPTISNNEIEKSCDSKELNHLFHMFENYIVSKKTDSIKWPTESTTPNHVDNIAQKFKEFLDNNKNQYRRNKVTHVPYQELSVNLPQIYNINEKPLITRKIDYMTEIQRQANQLKMTSSEISSKDESHSNHSEKNHNDVVKESKLNNTVIIKTKSLTEDIIKKITENIKKSVLKDLHNQISTKLSYFTKGTAGIAETITVTPIFTTPTTPTTSTAPTTTGNTVIIDNIYNVNIGSDHYKKTAPRFKKESRMEITTDSTSVSTSPVINQNDLKTATNALENFIKLFEQFKQLKDVLPLPNDLKQISQKGRTKNEFHGPINVVYPTLLPINYAFSGSTYNGNNTQVSSLFANPYGLHISNPMIQKTSIGKELKKSEYGIPYNNVENAMEHAINGEVIQTDDTQVPLLGIPVPNSVRPINQNIIVTTKHPTTQHREEKYYKNYVHKNLKPNNQDYTVRGHGKYDTDWDRESDSDFDRQFNADMERHFNTEVTRYNSDRDRSHGRDYGHGKYYIHDQKNILDRDKQSSRSRQAHSRVDNFYRDFSSDLRPKKNLMKPWEFSELPQEHKRDRYHEKLEKPYGWHYNHSGRDNEEKRLMVASRQQQPLNGLKKKTYDDDEHYLKVLKSQKKVNDMLERMLNPPDRIRSVEAI